MMFSDSIPDRGRRPPPNDGENSNTSERDSPSFPNTVPINEHALHKTTRRQPTTRYKVDTPGQTLHKAAERGDLDGVSRILQESPDCVDTRMENDRTPLHVAARKGWDEIVQKLLEHGADPNAQTKSRTPQPRFAEPDLSAPETFRWTPLMFAVERGNLSVIVTLARHKADLEIKNYEGVTALHIAVRLKADSPDAVYLLAVLGADVNSKNKSGSTVLHRAVGNKHYFSALTLCAFGADTTLRVGHDLDPFLGAHDVFFLTTIIGYPVMPGVREQMVTMLRKWSEPGMNLQQYRSQLAIFISQEKPIHLAAVLCWAAGRTSENHVFVMDFVLELSGDDASALVNTAGTREGWKALHCAAAAGQNPAVEFLIACGAEVDCQSPTHAWTPLLLAAQSGSQDSVAVLLNHGADILAKTREGRTAFELARDGRHTETLRVLHDHARRMKNSERRDQAMERYGKSLAPLAARDGPGNNVDTELQILRRSPDKTAEHNGPTENMDKSKSDSEDTDPIATTQGFVEGSYDGSLYSGPVSGLRYTHFFELLSRTWDNFDFKNKDKSIKVAIIDTGLDLTHKDWAFPRARGFSNGQPDHAEGEPCQHDRIKAFVDFTLTVPSYEKADMIDIDGHGTQVAGVILRFAPRAELYIARICEGNANRGALKQVNAASGSITRPQPGIVSDAIRWAIEQKVDIINMSFGFSFRQKGMRAALEEAHANHILVFAAMSNDGNNSPSGAAWPAKDSHVAIGVHSSKEGGKRSSEFTPNPEKPCYNFMVVGEDVITHWPEAKGGGFRLDNGTSFATPIVSAMAALVLAFTEQHVCKKEQRQVKDASSFDLKDLRQVNGMGELLQQLSESDESGKYLYIHPRLLWKGYQARLTDDKKAARGHAWKFIEEALTGRQSELFA